MLFTLSVDKWVAFRAYDFSSFWLLVPPTPAWAPSPPARWSSGAPAAASAVRDYAKHCFMREIQLSGKTEIARVADAIPKPWRLRWHHIVIVFLCDRIIGGLLVVIDLTAPREHICCFRRAISMRYLLSCLVKVFHALFASFVCHLQSCR